jgi:hypothetical protein
MVSILSAFDEFWRGFTCLPTSEVNWFAVGVVAFVIFVGMTVGIITLIATKRAGFFALLLCLSLALTVPAIAGEVRVLDKDYNVKYRIKDGKIMDKNYNVKGYVKDGKIYDSEWRYKGQFERERDRSNRGSSERRHSGREF